MTSEAENGEPRKRGGQPGNRGGNGGPVGNKNALRYGRYSFSPLGKAPRDLQYVYAGLNKLRRQLEAEVMQKFGQISTVHAALIQTVIRHEGSAQLASRWLREAGKAGPLSLSEKLAAMQHVERATELRDKALRALKLDPAHRGKADPYQGMRDAIAASQNGGGHG